MTSKHVSKGWDSAELGIGVPRTIEVHEEFDNGATIREIPKNIFKLGLNSSELRTYFAMRFRAGSASSIRITHRELAEMLGTSEETQRRAIDVLCLVQVVGKSKPIPGKSKRHINHYVFGFPPNFLKVLSR